MNCPVCNKRMVEKDFGGAHIDVCDSGCKGMWFDWMEVMKLDESHEGAGDALAQALQSPRVNDANRGRINCPKCHMLMKIHTYKRAQAVSVDECYGCGAFFLDSGELKLIRDSFMSDAEYAQFTEQLLGEVPDIEKYQDDLERRFVRGKAMLRFTRFMRPSFIIPKVLGQTPGEEKSIVVPELMEKYRKDPGTVRTPEMKALLDKYMAVPEEKRTPEMKAVVAEYAGAY